MSRKYDFVSDLLPPPRIFDISGASHMVYSFTAYSLMVRCHLLLFIRMTKARLVAHLSIVGLIFPTFKYRISSFQMSASKES